MRSVSCNTRACYADGPSGWPVVVGPPWTALGLAPRRSRAGKPVGNDSDCRRPCSARLGSRNCPSCSTKVAGPFSSRPGACTASSVWPVRRHASSDLRSRGLPLDRYDHFARQPRGARCIHLPRCCRAHVYRSERRNGVKATVWRRVSALLRPRATTALVPENKISV